MAGSSNQKIADTLVLSVKTVERHLANIYARLGLRGRVEAAASRGAARACQMQALTPT